MGRKQDGQRYERRALEELVKSSEFSRASAVFELGCGTGAFAQSLLAKELPADSSYLGVDVSSTMCRIASERLAGFGSRAGVEQSDGKLEQLGPAGAFDRFVSTYVLDLLGDDAIARALGEAYRLLAPGGLLCLASLTHWPAGLPGLVSGLWSGLRNLAPVALGGCRPIELSRYLDTEACEVRTRA
jgi:ubiquinone/menaquinone biosynthesis C-methylase UbiE